MTKTNSHLVLRSVACGLAFCAVSAVAILVVAAAPRTKAKAPDAEAVLPDPLYTAPQPWESDTLLPPSRPEYLPRVRIGEESRRGDTAKHMPMHPRPAVVLPEQARKSDASQPYPFLEQSSGPVHEDSPDPEQLFIPARLAGPDAGRPRISTDPTGDQSRQAALAAVPRLRQKPASFARLTIPDPFAVTEPLALHTTPPDNDPPEPLQDSAAGATLPLSTAARGR